MFRKMICLASFVLALGLVLPRACEAYDQSLVGYWTFDGGSGKTASDSSGNGYDGEVMSGSEWVTGYLGGALSFKAGGGVNVPPEAFSSIEKYVTLAFWAYGDPDLMPADTNVFQVHNSGGRVVGSHIPWSNGSVYFDAGGNRINKAATPEEYAGSWQHWTFTKDAVAGEQKIYLNGVLWHSGTGMNGTITGVTLFHIGCVNGGGNYRGMMDDFQLYNRALTEAEIGQIMQGALRSDTSCNPSPADEATDVPRDVALSWTPGEFAAKHDVYLGTVFNDVQDASRANPLGVLASQGQLALTYDPGLLDFGQTYYWRVDEVNAAPDDTIFKGNVWSFTVEPIGYSIVTENIMTTASSSNSTDEALENTINHSGLDADGLHSTGNTDMWLSNIAGPQPTWIQYEFDRTYKLYQMWVWNYNSTTEPVIGYGIKEATIEYSVDGVTWDTLGTTHEFGRGTGLGGYAFNTNVDFSGVAAKYVKITAHSNWGGLVNQYGLSEVRFLYLPVWAREPHPDSGATDVDVDVTLGWRAGREAAGHEVYLSTDEQAVRDGTAPVQTVTSPRYACSLDLASTYYWRVDDVNDVETPTIWQGDIWRLSTQEYLAVEDFESYNDIGSGEEGSNLVYETWIDGFGTTTNGSTIGYTEAFKPSLETSIVYDGEQSVPLFYDNTVATYSEVTAELANLAVGPDWTQPANIKTLTLCFYGDPANAAQQMYVKLNGSKVLYDGDAENITRIPWQTWNIDLASLGVNLSNVTTLTIGFERRGGVGGKGMVLLDGIRLSPFERQLITPAEPDTANRVAHYTFDGDFQDSSGNGHHGEPIDNVAIGSDPIRGQVASFDGDWDAVHVPLIGTSNEVTFAMWVYMEDSSREFSSCYNGDGWENGDLHFKVEYGLLIGHLCGLTRCIGTSVLPSNQWVHLACTLSTTETSVWIDGRLEASLAHPTDLETAPTITIGEGTIGAWTQSNQMLDRELVGMIDEVQIYDCTLTPEEMAWVAGRTGSFDESF